MFSFKNCCWCYLERLKHKVLSKCIFSKVHWKIRKTIWQGFRTHILQIKLQIYIICIVVLEKKDKALYHHYGEAYLLKIIVRDFSSVKMLNFPFLTPKTFLKLQLTMRHGCEFEANCDYHNHG